jgi:hypothetical protein
MIGEPSSNLSPQRIGISVIISTSYKPERGETHMKKIFTTKISLQSRDPTFSYSLIRLPRDLKELAGQIVNIYETEIEGVRGFFIAPHLANLAKLDEVAMKNSETNSQPKCDLIEKKIPIKKRPRARFEPASWPPQGRF